VGGFSFVEDGYGFADARIEALRGRRAAALAALRQAQRQGSRAGWRHYRDHDPAFAAIRSDPEFKAIFADMAREMAQQRARFTAREKDETAELATTR
jgi:hypothetical protein